MLPSRGPGGLNALLSRLLCGLGALTLVACAVPPTAPPPTPPLAAKGNQVDVYHGQAVADPYRWLEDDNSAETKAWVQAQNAVTQAYLKAMPQWAPTRRLVTTLTDYERFGLPFQRGGRYFWTRNDGLQQQSVLYTASALDAPPVVALDPNALSADGTAALTGTVPSPDGRLLAYGVAQAGSDWQTWRVRDLASGRDLPDELQWVKFSRAVWTPDGRGFFYTRYDAPKAGAALTAANLYQKLFFHRVGSLQADDQLVADNPAEKEWRFGADVFGDSPWLFISVSNRSGNKNGLMALPLPGGAYVPGRAAVLTMAFDAEYEPVGVDGGRLFLRTDKDAPRGRVVAVDLGRPTAPWPTLVPEAADAMAGATAVGGQLVLRYLHDASSRVAVHGPDGRFVRDLVLPGVGEVRGFEGQWRDSETFYSYTSLINPTEVHRLDVTTGRSTLFKRPQTAFDPSQFETRRAFVTSRDGTRFPVFIAHRKGLVPDGRNPTLLYGYGGFNVSMTPYYSVTAASWMKMGGVYVIAAIRGGGEYGAAWHEAGTQLRKQNVFDDFIAAAEWLIAQKITSPDRLAVFGGSNGGLLVGAVVNQRPELFGAAVPAVGVMDMLRFHKFTIGAAWINDYGSSDDAAQFKALRAYSPLHNIRSGVKYPPILVTTADHDDRVVPAHSFKYAATLQAADTGSAPKLIRIETAAGHGAGKPTSKIIEERADILAFIAHAFGMVVR